MFKPVLNPIAGFCGGRYLTCAPSADVLDYKGTADSIIRKVVTGEGGVTMISPALVRNPELVTQAAKYNAYTLHYHNYSLMIPEGLTVSSMEKNCGRPEDAPKTTFEILDRLWSAMSSDNKNHILDAEFNSNTSTLSLFTPCLKVAHSANVNSNSTLGTNSLFNVALYSARRQAVLFSADYLDSYDYCINACVKANNFDSYPPLAIMLQLWGHSKPYIDGKRVIYESAIEKLNTSKSYKPVRYLAQKAYITDVPIFQNYNYRRGSLCLNLFY